MLASSRSGSRERMRNHHSTLNFFGRRLTFRPEGGRSARLGLKLGRGRRVEFRLYLLERGLRAPFGVALALEPGGEPAAEVAAARNGREVVKLLQETAPREAL